MNAIPQGMNAGWTRIVATLLLALLHNVVIGADGKQPVFANETGWVWRVQPGPATWHSMCAGGLVFEIDELKEDKLLFTLARPDGSPDALVRCRPVAFNSSGQRFQFGFRSSGATAGVALQTYVLDLKTLPREQLKFIGIEGLTKENLRDVLAPMAFQKLRSAGLNALPFPRIGEPYNFELTTTDGTKISSRTLRGKVILLDFWASWCGPCMEKMPKLKETYGALHGRGLEIVGLNHDNTLVAAKRTIARQNLPWLSVIAPVGKEDQRELWMTANGTESLPRLLLIDRDGVLRADVSPLDLRAEIEKLVGNP